MRKAAIFLSFSSVFVVGCGQSPAPLPPHPVTVPVASVNAAPPPVTSVATQPESPANPPKEESQVKAASRNRVSLTLEPGKRECTLVFDGESFEDHPEWFVVTSVTRIATENGEGCAESVFYDFSKETRPHPEAMDPQRLVAGSFHKPGQTLPQDADGPFWNLTRDLNFDGIVDLCVVVMTGAYNYSQQCWLFDKPSRTFVRHTDLDDLIFLQVDEKKKKLTSAFRAGGPIYENNEYEWRQGKLVKTFQSISYFGEKPDGTPLSAGFSHWLIRNELKGGKFVKTFEGAIGDKK